MAVNYGTDTATLWTAEGPDLDPYARRISGGEAVAHAIARRLVTRRGSLAWDPDAGFDIRTLLNDSADADILLAIQSAIEGEAEKDERVARATATTTFDAAAEQLDVDLELALDEGPTFRLVLKITQLTLELLSVTPVT